jgi:hypothetical protein
MQPVIQISEVKMQALRQHIESRLVVGLQLHRPAQFAADFRSGKALSFQRLNFAANFLICATEGD